MNLEEHLESTFGYNIDAYGRDVAAIFGFGFLVRAGAVLAMWLKDRGKKR